MILKSTGWTTVTEASALSNIASQTDHCESPVLNKCVVRLDVDRLSLASDKGASAPRKEYKGERVTDKVRDTTRDFINHGMFLGFYSNFGKPLGTLFSGLSDLNNVSTNHFGCFIKKRTIKADPESGRPGNRFVK